MVALTRSDLVAHPTQNVSIALGDADNLGVRDRSFDAALCAFVLPLLSDPGLALEGLRRVTRPGGRIGISYLAAVEPRWRVLDEVWAEFIGTARSRWAPMVSVDATRSLLQSAGIADVVVVTDVLELHFASFDHWEAWSWSTGLRGLWELVPPARHAELRLALRGTLMGLSNSIGELCQRNFVRYAVGSVAE